MEYSSGFHENNSISLNWDGEKHQDADHMSLYMSDAFFFFYILTFLKSGCVLQIMACHI